MLLNSLGKYNKDFGFKTQDGLLIVFSGPSGVGKGTIVKELVKIYPEELVLSISATTRSPRVGEIDGKDYFFKTREEFDNLIKNNMLLEYASFNGETYGTPREYVEKNVQNNKNIFLEIEVQGALQIKKNWKGGSIFIFVLPPSFEVLEQRLRGRNTENEEAINNRLAIAHKEFEFISEYDYIIVNDTISCSVDFVKSIIMTEYFKVNRILV